MYVKVENGVAIVYPYSFKQLRIDNPNTSFPKEPTVELLNSYGVYPVIYKEIPSYNVATQNLSEESLPTLIEGQWVIDWEITNKTQNEITEYREYKKAINRRQRDELLLETDFYALSDVTMSAEMTTYRQALRDITSHANWPFLEEADWPTKP